VAANPLAALAARLASCRYADERTARVRRRRSVVCVLLAAALTLGTGTTAAAPIDGRLIGVLRGADRSDRIAEAYPSPSRIEARAFYSETLERAMPYFIYLPPGYDTSDRRYSVLYMLHGMGGSNTEWKGYNLLGTADNMIKSGELPPLLIVLPQGDQSYWVDHVNGGPRWGQYTAQDVVAEIDASWRTVPDRDHRAIGGLSMGAHGALQLAMRYPDVFGTVGAHSPTLRDYESSLEWFGPDLFGDEQWFAEHDPVSLIEAHPGTARRLKIWLDVGDGDLTWRPVVTDLHDRLVALGVPHEFHVLTGHHDGDDYWAVHSAEYLRFYGRALFGTAGAGAGAPVG
jgi:enterochelin esterase-like enzyme